MSDKLLDHLEKIKYFQAVAQLGSLHRTSQVLGISQSALSHSIKKLEEVLGTKLFHRSVRGVRLTSNGEELLRLATKIISEVNTFEMGLSFSESSHSRISIGSYDTISIYLVPKLLESLKPHSFDLKIEKSNQKLTHWLLEDKIDIAFMSGAPTGKDFEVQKIFDEYYSFFISSKKNSKHTNLKLDVFEDTPLLYFPQAIAGKSIVLDKVLNKVELKVLKKITADSFESIKAMTLEGLGIGLMPYRVGQPEVKRENLKQVEIKGLPNKIGKHRVEACWKKENSNRIAPILSEIRRTIKDINKDV